VKVGDCRDSRNYHHPEPPLEVEISVPIERAPELRTGMPVELLNGEGKRYQSRILHRAQHSN